MNGNPSIILYIVDFNYPSVMTVMLARAENTKDDIFFGTDTAHGSFLAMKRNIDLRIERKNNLNIDAMRKKSKT